MNTIARALERGTLLRDVALLGSNKKFASITIVSTAAQLGDGVRRHLDSGNSAIVMDPLRDQPVAMWHALEPSVTGRGFLVAEIRNDFLWGPLETLPGTEITAMSSGKVLFSSSALSGQAIRHLNESIGDSSVGDLEWEGEHDSYLASYRLLFLRPQFAHPGLMIVASQRGSEALGALVAFQALFPPAIVLAVLVAMLLSITQLRRRMIPLEKIIDGTKEIGRGNFSARVRVDSGDEFEVLAGSMNDMAERLQKTDAERERHEKIADERQEQLVQADKMASLGILVSGMAHEVNNPNSLIRLNTQLMRDVWADVATVLAGHYDANGDFPLGSMMYSEFAHEIPILLNDSLQGTERIARIVDDLKDFARQKPPEISPEVDVNTVCQSAVKLVRSAIDAHTDDFDESYHPDPQLVRGDFRRLEQVVVNLLINACQALPDRDKAVRLSTGDSANDNEVCIRVADEGRGIPAEALGHVMDPFFTTKRANGGTGLGLSICSTIVREHSGRLRFLPNEGGGTTAEFTLPSAGQSS